MNSQFNSSTSRNRENQLKGQLITRNKQFISFSFLYRLSVTSAAVISTQQSQSASWWLAMSASLRAFSTSARSASAQLPELPSLRWVPSVISSSFIFTCLHQPWDYEKQKQTCSQRCNQMWTRLKSSFSFRLFMNHLFNGCVFVCCGLFTFHSHALSPGDRLHNSFHFNLSIHLERAGAGLCVGAAAESEKSWSKFNSSEASNWNSLSKVMMHWWKRSEWCFTHEDGGRCRLYAAHYKPYTKGEYFEAGFWLSLRLHSSRHALNILLCASSFRRLHIF